MTEITLSCSYRQGKDLLCSLGSSSHTVMFLILTTWQSKEFDQRDKWIIFFAYQWNTRRRFTRSCLNLMLPDTTKERDKVNNSFCSFRFRLSWTVNFIRNKKQISFSLRRIIFSSVYSLVSLIIVAKLEFMASMSSLWTPTAWTMSFF